MNSRSPARTDNSIAWRKTNVLGIPFDFIALRDVIHVVEAWRRTGQHNYIAVSNPHSVMLCRRDAEMREATLKAWITVPDGIGIVLAARILGYGRTCRVTGPDMMLELCDRGREYRHRHFFYGGAHGVAERLTRRLGEMYPGLSVVGTFCPPFRALNDAEDREIVEYINSRRPDIVWVGLGAPKQEKWMADHSKQIDACALIGVGAAFDFHSGNVPRSPRWIRKWGLEWVYRLACEPRRMWRRNVDSPWFLGCVAIERVREELTSSSATSNRPKTRSIKLPHHGFNTNASDRVISNGRSDSAMR